MFLLCRSHLQCNFGHGGTFERVRFVRLYDCRQSYDVRLRTSSAKRSPRVELAAKYRDDPFVSSAWTPDTGAEVSVISRDQAEHIGISLDELKPSKMTLWSADGRKMQCMGTCDITLELGAITHTTEVSVIQSLHAPLLSWYDCVKLGILPPEFP